jgi:hypothetical protein
LQHSGSDHLELLCFSRTSVFSWPKPYGELCMTLNAGKEDPLARTHKIAIVMDGSMAPGMLANRAAVIATGLAARHGEIVGADIVTKDGVPLPGITKVPISVLQARNRNDIPALTDKARTLGCTVVVYLSRAQGLRSYEAYMAAIGGLTADRLDIDTLLVFGPRKSVNKITGNLPMLR